MLVKELIVRRAGAGPGCVAPRRRDRPGLNYAISGTNITLTIAPHTGDLLYATYNS